MALHGDHRHFFGAATAATDMTTVITLVTVLT
jgi:hypothetical protein